MHVSLPESCRSSATSPDRDSPLAVSAACGRSAWPRSSDRFLRLRAHLADAKAEAAGWADQPTHSRHSRFEFSRPDHEAGGCGRTELLGAPIAISLRWQLCGIGDLVANKYPIRYSESNAKGDTKPQVAKRNSKPRTYCDT